MGRARGGVAGGAVLAGTAAGAMVLCDPMVDPRGGAFTVGLDLIEQVAVVPHFDDWSDDKRRRTLQIAPGACRSSASRAVPRSSARPTAAGGCRAPAVSMSSSMGPTAPFRTFPDSRPGNVTDPMCLRADDPDGPWRARARTRTMRRRTHGSLRNLDAALARRHEPTPRPTARGASGGARGPRPVALAFVQPALALLVAIPLLGLWVAHRSAAPRRTGPPGRPARAGCTTPSSRSPSAGSPQAAAQELAEHAMSLLGAPSAIVLIEGIGDTVRVTAGEGSLYGDGSRMRLLDDNGTPAGSIAVSRARRRQAVLRARRAHPRCARAAGVVDPPPALAVRRGAARAAHDRRRARLVVRRDLLGEPRRRGAVVEPRDAAHHRDRRARRGRQARAPGLPPDRRGGAPAVRLERPGLEHDARDRGSCASKATARSGGSPAAGRRCRKAATSSSRATTPSARRSRTTRTAGSRRSATSCGHPSRRSRASCTRSSAGTPSSRPMTEPGSTK